ncbi:sensor histidine kinase [Flavobacterium soli]|uniref:sensor histidine kinase n=1 Tax=Flavobacterium soli TaxID=344881 RepID=UPI0012FACBE9|nr:sensor histidine kinase [Flavobacterium soli]
MKNIITPKRLLLIFSFISSNLLWSQDYFSDVKKNIKKNQFELAEAQLLKINTSTFNLSNKAEYHFLYGELLYSQNREHLAFQQYLLSKTLYKKANKEIKSIEINLKLAYLVDAQKNNTNKADHLLKEYFDFAEKTNNDTLLLKGYIQEANIRINPEQATESLYYIKKAKTSNKKIKSPFFEAKINTSQAILYNNYLNSPDSALYFLKKNEIYWREQNNLNEVCNSIINQSASYYFKKDYNKAIGLLQKADKIPIKEFIKNTKAILYDLMSTNYDSLNDYKNALKFKLLQKTYEDSLSIENQNNVIAANQIKFETREKELKNQSLVKTNKIIVYSFIGLLLVILTIGILAYKNMSKKKKIAEQEKLIETQKLEKTLKDQELRDIDLILESQEKERQQIANELHDDLGSMLATLKLNFQNLKRNEDSEKNENKLYEKTDSLIEEAYQKVRNISHLKNLGIVGNQGLLVAVKKMAEKMSVLERLKINVIPFGLTGRLDNQTEVTLFRIIQELCTNIIKHSGANEVNIYLTQHNPKELNLIIEDNGTGFDPKIITQKGGIGLKSIEQKVEQMGGTFTIDSILTKGTTIIIDLPI